MNAQAAAIRPLGDAFIHYNWPADGDTLGQGVLPADEKPSSAVETFSVRARSGCEICSVHRFAKADLASAPQLGSLQLIQRGDECEVISPRMRKNPYEIQWHEQLLVAVKVISNVFYPQMLKPYHTFEDSQHFYCVTERAGECTLAEFILKRGRVDESTAIYLTKQLISMVVEAHKETHITLSQLTPEELIVQGHGKRPKLKLNLLRHVWLKLHRQAQRSDDACDAPEEDEPDNANYVASDMWRVGLIVYMLLCGMPQSHADPKTRARTIIINVKSSFENHLWEGISPEARDFVKQLLWREPHKRLSPAKAFHHPWMENGRTSLLDLCIRHIVRNGHQFPHYAAVLSPLLTATVEEAGIDVAISRWRRSRQPISLQPEFKSRKEEVPDNEGEPTAEKPGSPNGTSYRGEDESSTRPTRWKSGTVDRDKSPQHADVLTPSRMPRVSIREESRDEGEADQASSPQQQRREKNPRRTTRSLSIDGILKRRTVVPAGARLSAREEQELARLNSASLITRTGSWTSSDGESGLNLFCSIADRMFSPNEIVSLRTKVEQTGTRSVAVESVVARLRPIKSKGSRSKLQVMAPIPLEYSEKLPERLHKIPIRQAGIATDGAWATDWILMVKLKLAGGHSIKVDLPVMIIPSHLFL